MSAPRRAERLATVALVALALAFPVGALLQPWLWPARSHMPAVSRQLVAPVLLVTVAGLRADRLHHLGAPQDVTPALDRLAEQGVSFRACWSASNQATASAAALLTGLCPQSTGVHAAGDVLAPRHETLAERFASAGYATSAIVANPELLDVGLEQGFARWDGRPLAGADEVVDAALQRLRADRDGAFLLWLDFADLLQPYGGPGLPTAAFAPDAPEGLGATPADYDLTESELAARGWGPRELAWMSARYDAALARLDAALGRLLDGLRQLNRLELLTVCVTGLRGERLDERPARAFAHGTDLFEGSLRVPLILRLPAQQSRGLRPTRLAQGIDVAPTLSDLWLRSAWRGPVGRPLKQVILSQFVVNRAIFAEGLVQPDPDAPPRRALAVRTATGKSGLKVVVDAERRLLGAFRFPEDLGERNSLQLAALQLELVMDQWQEALGDQAGCLP
ncbi:MAG: hypothetical protein FJ296_06885 [Planctomycetes bacterium]|nr:hypothetical protein [Planctomycetota bacterium]